MTLTDLLDHGRALEMPESQAAGIEEKEPTARVNRLSLKGFKGQRKTKRSNSKQCYCCAGSCPQKAGQSNCPARGTECAKCGKPNPYSRYCKSKNGGENQARNGSSSDHNEHK